MDRLCLLKCVQVPYMYSTVCKGLFGHRNRRRITCVDGTALQRTSIHTKRDRKSVGWGKSGVGRDDSGGGGVYSSKKKK